MAITFRPYDIGYLPDASAPYETVIQNGWSTYLVFYAVAKTANARPRGGSRLGVAVLECQGCVSAKFGYPNDEGLPEHPLFPFGRVGSPVLEVINSPWAHELVQQINASAKRIGNGVDAGSTPREPLVLPHFIVLSKEKTFECVASALTVRLFADSFQEAIEYVRGQLARPRSDNDPLSVPVHREDGASAVFESREVRIGTDRSTVEVIGIVKGGHVRPGLHLAITLNSTLDMTLPIREVIRDRLGQVILVLECEDEDGAALVEGLNFANELLKVHEPPSPDKSV
jgi:hypothetical protein